MLGGIIRPGAMASQVVRRDQAKRRLLDAALDVFGEKGFSESSLEEVAQRAGVSRGLIYHHFGSKESLLLELHHELHRSLLERVQLAAVTDQGPLENLVRGSSAFLEAAADLPVARLFLLETPAVPGLRKYMEERQREWLVLISGELARAVRNGAAAPLDPDMMARLLLGALQAATLAVVSDPDSARASHRARRSFARVIQGLRMPEGEGASNA